MQGRHLFILLAFALFASPLAAQETTGRIDGRITDTQSLAVPGAAVTATGTQGSKSTTTDGDGRYSIPFLTPGELLGARGAAGLQVRGAEGRLRPRRQAADVSLKLEVGGVSETVQVTGARRVVDTTSTTIGAVLNTDDLKSIPVGRTFSATMYLSPGVSSSGTAGRANPSMSGASGLENQYVVDGTNVTNTGYGGLGSYSITSARSATRRPTISSRKSRSRPAATRPSSVRRPAASSTSSPRAARTSCAGRRSPTRSRPASRAAGSSTRPPMVR